LEADFGMSRDETSAFHLRPEAELLLSCGRAWLGSEAAERIRGFFREDMDFEYLYRIAVQHGMVPILYWGLHAASPSGVPPAFEKRLRDDVQASNRRNLFMTGELLKILSLLESHHVPAVPFKGPVLAAAAHANLSLRQFLDLDILIRREDVAEARKSLISLGYEPEFYRSEAQEAAFVEWASHYTFSGADKPLIVEIHWRIGSPYFCPSLALEPMWERLERMPLGGREVLTFCPEDLLLLLSAHGARHCWERLMWILDIARLISVPEGLDWEEVMSRARAAGVQRMLLVGLFLARRLFGVGLPGEALESVKAARGLGPLAVRVRRRLFREVDAPVGPLERFFFHVNMMDGVGSQIRYCLRYARHVTTPTVLEWESLPLPDSLFPLYYVFRPVRLMAKYAVSLWRRVLP
jgi:hypothetical protein